MATKTSLLKSKKSPKVKKPSTKTEKVVLKPKPIKKQIVWTAARKHSFIVSILRSGTRKYPPKYEALAGAYVGQQINKKTGRLCKHYKCNVCGEVFPASEMSVDHLLPVIGVEGFTTWDSFIENLFCEKDNLQVLDTECHDEKTKTEKQARAIYRASKK